ncbi:MAG: DUF6236 family protein [Bacteroidota bacterium]
MSERGIIVVPPFEINGPQLSTKGPITPESLRQYLLYWDKIEWPSNNIIEIGGESPETKFLKEERILQRTKIQFSSFSGNLGFALLTAQEAAFRSLNKNEPGCWALAQPTHCLSLPKDLTQNMRTVEVELYSSIPVPVPEVSLDDILNFKHLRKDELLAFRLAMDELYEKVISSEDIPRAKLRAIESVEKTLLDLNKVFSETWKDKLLSSVKVELNFPNIATNAAIGLGVGSYFGLSPALSAAIGATSAALKFDFKISQQSFEIPSKLRDFAYLHKIEKELK